MGTTTIRPRKFKGDQRGVSNVIVVVLSLVILVIVASNVVFWSYHMNEVDWERINEDLEITDVVHIPRSTWSPAQGEFAINEGSLSNGSYVDTQIADSIFETFLEAPALRQQTLHPSSAGQYTQWNGEYPMGTAHWDCCDDGLPDEDTSYVEDNSAAWKKETYNLENYTDSGTINWIRVYVRARLTEVGASQITTLVRTYGTGYESSAFNLTTSYQTVYTQYDANPNTGLAWTWSELGSLEAGASGIKTEGQQYTRMTAVWVVIDYTPSASYRLDGNATYNIDLEACPLSDVQTIEIQLRFRASDQMGNWYLKAYNWTSLAYSDLGFNRTTGYQPTSGWDEYAVNLTDKWLSYVNNDGVMWVKFQDNEEDANQTSIDIDFLGVTAVVNGTRFTFECGGSVTCHLVSLWVNNATHHKRFDISIFVNSGDTRTYLRSDLNLPEKPYSVKVVTDRGNIAVYSEG